MTAHVVSNTNDGTRGDPYLCHSFVTTGLVDLPSWSTAPRGSAREVHLGLKAAGMRGVQGGDPALCRELGLRCMADARVFRPEEIAPLAGQWKREGMTCATLLVGSGHESDAEIDALVGAVLSASTAEDLPIYIETHRASITQDTWRTVQMIERHPGVRFNADLSHWYTGLLMRFGNIEEKWTFMAPIFERVRYMHGRLGNSGHIQMPLDHPSMAGAIPHFREMWTRCMVGFLRTAQPGDYLCFAPELLSPQINFAPTAQNAEQAWVEASDRWCDAVQMLEIATACWDEAQRRRNNARMAAM
ncbi:MAG: hypothetical protein AAB263_10835 [Planctomycetota bacterium]